MADIDNNTSANYEEISLRELIMALWNGKKLIAIITTVTLILSAVISFAVLDEQFESSVNFRVSPISFDEFSEASDTTIFNEINSKISLNIAQHAAMIRSHHFAETVSTDFNLDSNQFSNMLSISTDDKNNTISVKVTNTDPIMAYEIANAIVEKYSAYLEAHIKANINEYIASAEKSVSVYQAEIDGLRQELNNFRNNYGEIDLIEAGKENTIIVLASIDQEMLICQASINADIASLDAVIDQLNVIGITDLSTSNLITEIRTIAKGESGNTEKVTDMYLQLNPKVGDNSIAASALTLELNRLQLELIDNFNRHNALEQQRIELEQEYSDNLSTYLEFKPQYDAAKGKYDMAVSTYNTYSKRLEAVSAISSIDIVNPYIMELTSPQLPKSPSAPNKMLNLAIGLVLGLMLGVFVVFFKEYWKNSEK